MAKKILVLGTGGTVSSSIKKSEGGLSPVYSVDEIFGFVPEIRDVSICAEMPIKEGDSRVYIDSTNMQPEYIQQVARRIYSAYRSECIDGVVVLHGTDTTEESCADLTFELLYKKIPVVLTGSMKPIDDGHTDAVKNITHAIKLASQGRSGTYLVFNGRIISAARAKKIHPSHSDAFRSVNFPQLGRFVDDEPEFTDFGKAVMNAYEKRFANHDMKLRDGYSTKTHLMELYRGIKPSIIDYFFDQDYEGLVLEAFGTGGIPNSPEHASFIPKIKRWGKEKFIGIVSKSFTGQVTNNYKVNTLALQAGAVSLRDMTSTAALAKISWAFGQTSEIEEVKSLVFCPFENEINSALFRG